MLQFQGLRSAIAAKTHLGNGLNVDYFLLHDGLKFELLLLPLQYMGRI